MEVVPDACAIWCGVVVAKYGQFLANARCRLGQVGDEVVGHAKGQFSNDGGRVGANGVEVPKQGHMGPSQALGMIRQHAFTGLICPTLRGLCGLNRSGFRARYV